MPEGRVLFHRVRSKSGIPDPCPIASPTTPTCFPQVQSGRCHRAVCAPRSTKSDLPVDGLKIPFRRLGEACNRGLDIGSALSNVEFPARTPSSNSSLVLSRFAACSGRIPAWHKAACAVPGVLGARITGGGFGGCTVNFAQPDAFEPLKEALRHSYFQYRRMEPDVYLCVAAPGCR